MGIEVREGQVMLKSLKQVGRTVSQGLGHALENISDGWHDLLHRSGGALTHFAHPKEAGDDRPMTGALTVRLPQESAQPSRFVPVV